MQLEASCIKLPQLNGCRPTISRDDRVTAGLREIDVTAITADAERAVYLSSVGNTKLFQLIDHYRDEGWVKNFC